ncbi:MAG: hypothetical protein ABUL67_01685 [Haliangium ochraceum]
MIAPPSALLAFVLTAAASGGGTGANADKPFRTEVAPRIDPVFSDTAGLRETIDQFLALQAEMETVRDQFSGAVHDAMAQLGPIGAAPPKTCPPQIPRMYARAAESGRRFLALGRRFAARYRDIHRAEDLGDTVGLTPDYRAKAKKARELYLALVRDYREMRAAFYDQLQGEMRHAGCKLTPLAATAAGAPADGGAAEPAGPDPTNPGDWELEPPDDAGQAGKRGKAAAGTRTPESSPTGGPAIWIQIDNTRCTQPSALTIDGRAIGDIAAQKKVPVRTHAGPHELCVLPVNGKQVCGGAATVRRVYLYDGWTLAVRCGD